MAIGVGGISKTSSLFAQNALRLNSLMLNKTNAQLSSGNRLAWGSIDPSGLAISQGFRSQIGGTDMAMTNTQEAVNLTRTADATLGNQGEVLGRMRDIAVRAGNDATLTDADRARLDTEYQSLNDELTRSGEASSFNGKQLTSEANPYGTQQVQAGPNNDPNQQIDVQIDPSTANAGSLNTAGTDVTTAANAGNAIDRIDTAIGQLSNQRASLGVTERVMQYRTNDLAQQRINMSAANSRIADTDFAATISQHTKGLLLNKIGISMLSQSNAQGMGVLKLLGAG